MGGQEGGASFVTLHPRTKSEGYRGRAAWPLIGRAVDVLSIPVVSTHSYEKRKKNREMKTKNVHKRPIRFLVFFWAGFWLVFGGFGEREGGGGRVGGRRVGGETFCSPMSITRWRCE